MVPSWMDGRGEYRNDSREMNKQKWDASHADNGDMTAEMGHHEVNNRCDILKE